MAPWTCSDFYCDWHVNWCRLSWRIQTSNSCWRPSGTRVCPDGAGWTFSPKDSSLSGWDSCSHSTASLTWSHPIGICSCKQSNISGALAGEILFSSVIMLSILGCKQQEGCVHEKPLCQIHLSFSLIFLLSSTPGSGFAEDRKVTKDKTFCNELRFYLWQLAIFWLF